MPNGMRVFLGLVVLAGEASIELSVDDVLATYYPQENFKDKGRYSMYPRKGKQIVGEMRNADRYWQNHYFFMHINEKSMGGLANAFYPLWGILHKESKKPPPQGLLFEEKLERLLALPKREWDEINTPQRFRASNLWKNFVEIPSGIPKRVPPWVDWSFVVRGALRRLFGAPLFIDALTDEEALIADFALDTMVMDFPNPKEIMAKRKAAKEAEKAAAAAAAAAAANTSKGNEPDPFPVLESSPEPPAKPASPIAKKRKAIEKGKRKLPAKRSKKSKVATPEADDEGPRVEVNLPLRARLLQDRQTSVEIMHQLLSDADAETLSQGPLQAHIDDLLWDGLKTNIRAMGLMKRTTEKNLEQRARLKELEAKDKRREEMLMDIERKFSDVKTKADGLTADLKEVMHQANEGVSMMGVMVERFDEAQAKIKNLETENAALATQIIDAFEKATIKVRYDLLKEYKQGLFVDADIDEELELYKDEMEGPSSAPEAEIEPTSIDPGQPGVEPPAHEDMPEVREPRD